MYIRNILLRRRLPTKEEGEGEMNTEEMVNTILPEPRGAQYSEEYIKGFDCARFLLSGWLESEKEKGK